MEVGPHEYFDLPRRLETFYVDFPVCNGLHIHDGLLNLSGTSVRTLGPEI